MVRYASEFWNWCGGQGEAGSGPSEGERVQIYRLNRREKVTKLRFLKVNNILSLVNMLHGWDTTELSLVI